MNLKGIYQAPIKNLGNNLGKTGYIQNMFKCLKIKNLQEKFLRFFFLPQLGGWVGGWVETPVGKFQLDFFFEAFPYTLIFCEHVTL